MVIVLFSIFERWRLDSTAAAAPPAGTKKASSGGSGKEGCHLHRPVACGEVHCLHSTDLPLFAQGRPEGPTCQLLHAQPAATKLLWCTTRLRCAHDPSGLPVPRRHAHRPSSSSSVLPSSVSVSLAALTRSSSHRRHAGSIPSSR
jgi:hypothetical protein